MAKCISRKPYQRRKPNRNSCAAKNVPNPTRYIYQPTAGPGRSGPVRDRRQAFILYEDELTDSKAQVRALVSMAGTLLSCEGFDPADYDALATKTAQYAAKLLKKPDQCRMVTLCSHLFWSPDEVSKT